MKSFETDLPEGYREVYTVDAKSAKTSLLLTLASFVLTVAAFAVFLPILPLDFDLENGFWYYYSRLLITLGAMVVYLILHELTHGVVYKIMTKQKLKFGMTLTVAFCGVPDIYVYRKTALLALLAPFVVFSVVLIGIILLLPEPIDKLFAAFLFSIHFGGCVGDLYDTLLYLFKFRSPDTLMRDTGPKQTFYLK